MTHRYAVTGSDEFNTWLDTALTRLGADVATVVGDNLHAVVLAGGYGRGDGCVVRRQGIEFPYNDLDLLLVVDRPAAVPEQPLLAVSARYARRLRVHVDFGRHLTIDDIRQWPHKLLWHDVAHGHRVIHGDRDIISRHASPALLTPPPLVEASRLLLNRGAGLLQAMRIRRGVQHEPDEDFVRRNAYKTALALGDAILLRVGRYTAVAADKLARLDAIAKGLPGRVPDDVREWYRLALDFRASPDLASDTVADPSALRALAAAWRRVFLQIESARVGLEWPSVEAYARWRGIREPEEHGWRLGARNVVRSLRCGHPSLRYPREVVYRRLPVLLEDAVADDRDRWADEGGRLLRLWQQVN